MKPDWKIESLYISRYVGSGVINTIVGFGIIFFLMWLGVSPYISNMVGYVTGFIVSFILNKQFVFKSDGHIATEGIRFILAFLICYSFNLLVLKIAIDLAELHPVLSQFVAAGSYSSLMYVLSRTLIFTSRKPQHLPKQAE